MSLGEEIRRLASLKGLDTQQKIADATGLSQSFVARLLSGSRPNLSADVLYKLCDALGVGCDHFRPFLSGDELAAEPEPPAKASGAKKPKGKKG